MLFLRIAIVLVAAVVLDGLLPMFAEPFRYIDPALIATVYFALMRDPAMGMLVGFAAGLGGDLAPGAGPIVGVGGFSKTAIGFLVASVAVRAPLEGPLVRILVLGVASLANSALALGLFSILDQDVAGALTTGEVARKMGFEAAGNLILGVFIFWIIDKLFPEHAAQGQMQVRRRFYD